MLRVTALTGGKNVPSARFRVRQYVPALQRLGVRIDEYPAMLGAYPPRQRWLRPFWTAATLAARLPGLGASRRSDVTLLQREMLSTFLTLEPLTKAPRVLDVDDAIWMNRDNGFAARLAALSNTVVCGNTFLADYFAAHAPKVVLLPTAVDTDAFVPTTEPEGPGGRARPRIGWMGTASNFAHLALCEPALGHVLARHPDVELLIVSNERPRLPALPIDRVRFVRWSASEEVRLLQQMDIGIMPLQDSTWARGKCSFKMLTYMACGLPVVVSPVGMNRDILARGRVGFGATSTSDWVDALDTLLHDRTLAASLGAEGRRLAVDEFSVRALAPRLAAILKAAAS